jgi:hypothetical protein
MPPELKRPILTIQGQGIVSQAGLVLLLAGRKLRHFDGPLARNTKGGWRHYAVLRESGRDLLRKDL